MRILVKHLYQEEVTSFLEALKDFEIEVKNKICVDVGSSTGGFTDCLLQCGANFVYSIDVGINQLSYKLRIDPRVKVLERTNILMLQNLRLFPILPL